MVIDDAKALFDLIDRARTWRREASERTKKKKAQAAAQILFDAGVLVAAMRTYDNTYRRVLRRVRLLQPDASDEERKSLVEELTAFNESHVITPHIDQASGSLAYALYKPNTRKPGDSQWEALEKIVRCAQQFQLQIQRPIEEDKTHLSVHYEIKRAILHSSSDEELQVAVNFAEAHLDYLSLN